MESTDLLFALAEIKIMNKKTYLMNVAFLVVWILIAVFETYVVFSYTPLIPLLKIIASYVFVIAIALVNAIALKNNSTFKLNIFAQLSNYCLIAILVSVSAYIFIGRNDFLVATFKSEYLSYVLMFVIPALLNLKALRALRALRNA
jgi:hypothetical protein